MSCVMFIEYHLIININIAGYYIGNNSGNPAVFRLMFQHYAYENLGSPDWEFDGTIATTQGKGNAVLML